MSESRVVLIGTAIAVVVLLLFGLSLGAVLLVSQIADPGGDATLQSAITTLAPSANAAQVGAPDSTQEQVTSTNPVATTTSSDAASETNTPLPTQTTRPLPPTATAAPSPTTPAATQTPPPSPTVPAATQTPLPPPTATTAPSPTVPIATRTLPPPTATAAPSPTVPAATRTPPPPSATPAQTPTVPTTSESIVTVPSAFVYDGPSSTNSIIGGVERDDRVVILGSSGTWYLIRLTNPDSARSRIEGGQGWIPQNVLSPPSQPVPVITP